MPPEVSTADGLDSWSQAGSPAFLRSLDRLRINVGEGTTIHPGNNPVPRATQDSGLEFAKHRPYTPGDDLRHIDWNALARHDSKLVKTFRAEREAPLHLLVDASASMATPASDGKFRAAAAIATCLAYISLRNRDPVRAAVFDEGGARSIAPLLRHPQRLPLLVDELESTTPSGATNLTRAVESYLHSTRLPGVAVVLSDFLVAADDYQAALRCLLASGYRVAALRVIGNDERNPAARTRRVRLWDVESSQERIIDLTQAHVARYQAALDAHIDEIHRWCTANGIPFCLIETGLPPSRALTFALPAAGVLR